ncbi:hypothetical protein AB4Z50_14555 [Paenibacillus sp. 2TAB26]|uniref:hypothetical protein n=1 Tax=Paenibacillus sp. 2TAB26 TaxID=3233005 RepID=UPI003F96F923
MRWISAIGVSATNCTAADSYLSQWSTANTYRPTSHWELRAVLLQLNPYSA